MCAREKAGWWWLITLLINKAFVIHTRIYEYEYVFLDSELSFGTELVRKSTISADSGSGEVSIARIHHIIPVSASRDADEMPICLQDGDICMWGLCIVHMEDEVHLSMML